MDSTSDANVNQPQPSAANRPKFTPWQIVTLVSSGLALLSLFLPWVDIGFSTRSGWDERGYIGVAAFAIPILLIFRPAPNFGNWIPIVLGSFAVLFGAYSYTENLESFTWGGSKETIDLNGSGIYLYLAASVGLLVAAIVEFQASRASNKR